MQLLKLLFFFFYIGPVGSNYRFFFGGGGGGGTHKFFYRLGGHTNIFKMTDLCNEQYSIFVQIIGGGTAPPCPPYSYGPVVHIYIRIDNIYCIYSYEPLFVIEIKLLNFSSAILSKLFQHLSVCSCK